MNGGKEHALEWHGCIHRNQPRNSANPKRYCAWKWLAWPCGALHKLLECDVCRKPDGGVRSLTHHLEWKGRKGREREREKIIDTDKIPVLIKVYIPLGKDLCKSQKYLPVG